MFNKKRKEEPPKADNKFAGKRKYHGRAGMPQTTLKRLEDFYELLQCDPDGDGYVVTTYEEIMELTHMDTNMLTIMLANGMIIKRTTGSSPKFKYKWDTIKPTLDMAVKLLEERGKYQSKWGNKKEEAKPEAEAEEIKSDDVEITASSSALMDYMLKDDILIIRVNTKMIDVEPKSVIKSVMKALLDG